MAEIQHLGIEELLALRDGEGTYRATTHIESCAECRRELDRLYQVRAALRALRPLKPPRNLWPRVAAVVSRRRVRARTGLATAGLAAAAVLAGALVLRAPLVDEAPRLAAPVEFRDVWRAESRSADLGPMIVRADELETILRDYAPTYQVFDAPTALVVSVLEDRIQLIDAALTESRAEGVDRELLRGLWTERVSALETLVGLQVVERDQVWR